MQRRTLLQALSAGFAALFVGVSRAVQTPLLPAIRVAKRGISAMPFVKILERPIRRNDGAYVVATMVGASGDRVRVAGEDWRSVKRSLNS